MPDMEKKDDRSSALTLILVGGPCRLPAKLKTHTSWLESQAVTG